MRYRLKCIYKERGYRMSDELFRELDGLYVGVDNRRPISWERIDHHTDPGRLNELVASGVQVLKLPYIQAVDELTGLANGLKNIPVEVGELIEQSAEAVAGLTRHAFDAKIIAELMSGMDTYSEVVGYAQRVREGAGSVDQIEANSLWFFDEGMNVLFKYIDPLAHALLERSRSTGVIPESAQEKVSKAKIRVMGASADSPAADQLVSLGASNMTIYDAGVIDPTNMPRFLGAMGSVLAVGLSKSLTLVDMLRLRNPHGTYHGYKGRVLAPEDQDFKPGDIEYSEFFDGADIILEGIDGLQGKGQVEEWARENAKGKLMGFFADLGSLDPVVVLSIIGDGDHFGQNLTKEQIHQIAEPPSPVEVPPIHHLFTMLGETLTHAHALQLLLYGTGQMNFWAQSPLASRGTAALLGQVLLAHYAGKDVLGKPYTLETVPKNLMNDLTDEQQKLLRRIILAI